MKMHYSKSLIAQLYRDERSNIKDLARGTSEVVKIYFDEFREEWMDSDEPTNRTALYEAIKR